MVRPFFEPRDLWRGVYWNVETNPVEDERGVEFGRIFYAPSRLTIWVCPLPMCVLRIDLVARECNRVETERG